ncbi:MAG TPA: ATP-binding protein [Steroidobacteraceae bacterium]|nr:ATP-binding protein [Steroidobacteraceae bacterium]
MLPVKRVSVLLCLSLMAMPRAAPAAEAFQRYNVSDGLANNLVFDVAEDKYGFVWMTTRDGISKFDGSEFTTYRPIPDRIQGQVAQFYQTIAESRDGSLWFCSWGNGLLKLDLDTEHFTFYRHDTNDPQSIAGNEVWFAFEDRDGMIWVSSLGGLSRLDPRTGKAHVYLHDPSNPNTLSGSLPSKVVQDESGKLWIGTYGGGLDRLDLKTQTFTHYRHSKSDANSLSNDLVEGLFLDRDGTLWISTDAGLDHFDPRSGRFKSYKHDPNDPLSLSNDEVLEARRDSRGRLWAVNWGGGINRLDEASGTFAHYLYEPGNPLGLSTSLAMYFRESRDGAIWFGSFNGLNRYDEQGGRFQQLLRQPGTPGASGTMAISGAQQDRQGRIWVTSDDIGLLRYDPAKKEYRTYGMKPGNPHSLSNGSATAITMDALGAIWIGTRGGFDRYDPQTDGFERFTVAEYGTRGMASDNISDITTDAHGFVWLTMYGVGLQRFDPKTGTFTLFRHASDDPASLGNDQTNAVRVAMDGSVWVGSDAGLSRLDPESGKFANFAAGQAGLSSIIVNAIVRGRGGAMLFGTDVGVDAYDPASGRFTAYTVREGMPSNYVMALEADLDGNIWAGTDRGLARIDIRTRGIRVFGIDDGLPSDQFWNHAASRGADGTLYFGGMNGLAAFQPAQIVENRTPPPVYITEFSLFNHKVVAGPDSPLKSVIHLTRNITLSYRQSSLGFKFAALNYRWPRKNRYAYKLEGFDDDWTQVDSSRRQAVYTNLPPGHYIFRVRASNNDGLWNDRGAALAITITPPWWQTLEFRTVALLATLAIFYAAYRLRVRQLEGRARNLQQIVAERTRDLVLAKEAAEIANRAKSAFLASVSHELRTPLNGILGYAQILLRSKNHDPRHTRGLNIIQQSGEHLLMLINDILDSAKIEAGRQELSPEDFSLDQFLRAIVEIIRVKAEAKHLRLVCELAPDLPEVIRADERRLRQILLNLLANAVKFTDRGEVCLNVKFLPPARLSFEVRDTGIGIDEKNQKAIFQPFSQVGSADHRRGGTGLGLAISRQFAHLMGSDIEVESRPGQGSVFKFALDVELVSGTAASPRLDPITGYAGYRRRILVADDVMENRAVLRDMLEPLGFEISEAEDGWETLEKVRSQRPDLILMDVFMPKMDGLETIRRLRERPDGADLRVITVSASASGSDEQSALEAGANAFLSKPIDVHILFAQIGRLLGIDWIRTPSGAERLPVAARGPFVVPPPSEMQILHHLALQGNMRDVAQRAEHLCSLDERYRPFAEHLGSLARQFQSGAILRFVEQHMETHG